MLSHLPQLVKPVKKLCYELWLQWRHEAENILGFWEQYLLSFLYGNQPTAELHSQQGVDKAENI